MSSVIAYGMDFLLTLGLDLIIILAFIYIVAVLPWAGLAVVFVLAVPSICGGLALGAGKSWGLRTLKIISAFYIVLFPLGTAIGIYTLVGIKRIQREQSTQHKA